MSFSIAHLGPTGTYTETAALLLANWLNKKQETLPLLCPYPSIAQTLQAVAQGKANLAVVPVENSIEGSVTMTLDTLWQLDNLRIQQAIDLPIVHAFLSHSKTLSTIQTVYSHPQALAQCQGWLEKHLPQVQLIPTRSTTEALQSLGDDETVGAISSQRAAELYNLPVIACPINDYPDNCTRFWILGLNESPGGSHTSLAFSVRANIPGALVQPLQIFADRDINLSRIESRPTKRSLGDYLFFMDLEGDANHETLQTALQLLKAHTETLKIFGSYAVFPAKSMA
ncbi:prephenate dehydratase [Geitlerinema sp. PCC 7407]|uniref:prephenate dehydratase n=1 Tax=Geitlerinema sp. PCC 7407 TaxID=1173025 RepID=UPI00029F9C1E|nr:prephenate dehydratase [Geitlerinema sp. PCC 7407]AFY67308.1 prephenate dehydratase [Geitlerinema sp. PCC 7407]